MKEDVFLQDMEVLYKRGVLDSATVNEMMKKAEKSYVLQRHPRTISRMNSTGRKNGMWKTYIYVDGKRKEVLGKTEDEVFSKLWKHYKELDDSRKTVQQAFELLCEYKKECLNRSQNTIDEDTKHFRMLSDSIRNMEISSVTEEIIRKWIVSELLPIKPKVSRFKKILEIIDQVFNLARRKKLCTDNPMLYISAKEYLRYCDSSQKTDEEKAFSKEELTAIVNDAEKYLDNPRVLMSLMAIESGLRAGELCALHFDDIKAGYIHVHRQQIRENDQNPDSPKKQIHYEVPFTKEERTHPHDGRYVPLTSEAKRVVELASKIEGESVYLFHDPGKSEMVTESSYAQNLRTRCRRLGCKATNNHAFRMAYNSRLIELGFSAADRALLLGHMVQTNESHYSLTDKRRLEDIKKRFK